MTRAMIGYLIGLIYCNTRTSCGCLASLTELAHDRLYRLLYLYFPYSRWLREWFAARLAGGGQGYLILDDTTWQRWTRKAEAVSLVWDARVGQVVFGMNVVLLIWTDGRRNVPLELRVWQKGGKSNVKMAEELLLEARQSGLTPEFVLFDCWYSSTDIRHLTDSFGWRYICRAKRNRLFERVKISRRCRHRVGRAIGSLREIRHQILLVKDGQKFLLTNSLELTSQTVKQIYRKRQPVEETCRVLKQEFGSGKCRARSKQAQTADLDLGLYALCLVQMKAENETVYRFKENLFREAIPTQHQFIQTFTVFA